MGARQSKRSVDISATPPKKGAEENGGVASEDPSVKLEKVPENVENVKATLNGDATHTEATPTVNGTESPAKTEETPAKAEEATPETVMTPEKVESPDATSPVTSPDEKAGEEGDKTSEKQPKEKKRSKIMKSLRSLSFKKTSKPEKMLTSPKSEDKKEKTEENGTEGVKSEEPTSPLSNLTAVIEETGAAAAAKIEEKLTEVKKEGVTVCEKVIKEVTEKVEAVVEKVEAVVEKKSEPEKAEKTESAPAEEVPPPLPASPPPSELPSPPVAPVETIKNVVNEHQQQDVEEMNGGGESLAEFTPETEETQVLVNGDHAVTNGTNGIDEEIKPPTSDKVEEDLSSKMESLKMANSEDLPEIIDQKTEVAVANE